MPTLHPALLPAGTVVGSWRVTGWAGRGVYGAVYRAVPVDDERAAPVAIKMALHPGDPRSVREVELLSRQSHPGVPRLLGHGEWQSPSGTRYAYTVMQWVDGIPLYEWALLHPPSPRQVLRLAASLARSLQSLHALGAIHRDVKGDNVLVRRSDSQAFLMDYGSGIYPGAAPLTPPGFYPGTPVYRSPESWLFDLQFMRAPTTRYTARPADDLYALGVTACRLLTGDYPELAVPTQDEHGTWHLEAVLLPPALQQVDPRLRAWVLRMLSLRPEERGTAQQIAEGMEQAAEELTEARPPTPREVIAPSPAQAPSAEKPRPLYLWRAMATVAVALAVWTEWVALNQPAQEPSATFKMAAEADQPNAGSTGIGEAVAPTSTEHPLDLSPQQVMAEDTPPEPQPGQARPDSKGRCPRKQQIALNDGCWVEVPFKRGECEEKGGFVFKTKCYLPSISPGRPPTSHPPDRR